MCLWPLSATFLFVSFVWLLNVSSRSTGGGHLSFLLVSQNLLPTPLLFREWPTLGTPLPQEQPDAWLSQHGGQHTPSSASQSAAPSADSNSEARNLRREAPVASELLVVWKQRHLMFGGSSGCKMWFFHTYTCISSSSHPFPM